MQTDRRTNRSNVPGEALSLALAAAATRAGAHAAVIADEDGFLLAGAGNGFDHDWIAAFAPVLSDLTPAHQEGLLEITRGNPLHSTPIRVNGARLYFAAVGGSPGDIGRVEAAADRILAA